MVKYIGCYNVDNLGEVWDGNECFIMVIFSKFDGEKEVSRKRIYFLAGKNKLHAVPEFKTDEEITEFLKDKKNNEKCRA